MSTRVPFQRDRCPDQESLVSFLYDEFDGSEAYDRRTIAHHVEVCDRCARSLASLGGVRDRLRAWDAPDTSPLGLRIVSDATPRAPIGWAGWMKTALPLAAAAILVIGAGLGLARLDIQYDKSGFRVRTGWGHEEQNVARGSLGTPPGATVGLNTPITAAGLLAPVSDIAGTRAPWQADMQTLAQSLRQEIATTRLTDAVGARPGATTATAAEVALMKRLQQLIDQAEVRQQQNLALRVTELSRDFDLQRRSDMAQIEQGFGRLAGQRELDAQQQRLLLNAIRTSQQVPVAPR
jgi:hypothetical protein